MNLPDRTDETAVIRAEAAAWLARLRSDTRGRADETAFRAWIAADPRHGEAFQAMTEVFEIAGAQPIRADRRRREAVQQIGRRRLLQGAGLAAAAAVGGVLLLRPDATYATAIGEQRRVVLKDRTVVNLDTDTRLSVRMEGGRRAVTLEKGRAAFQVARDPERPFHVTAGDRKVIATEARFDVSRIDDRVVVLAETASIAVGSSGGRAGGATEYVSPGRRVEYQGGRKVSEDAPTLADATAWRDGRLSFNGDTLSSAVRQMNRYSPHLLVVADPSLAAEPISGVYRAGESRAFAESVAVLLGARVRAEGGRIVLDR
jgi:transmembrane sensor